MSWAPWLGVEWRGKSVIFYLAFKVQVAEDSRDMFKGTPDIALWSWVACGLWPEERCWGGEHSALGLICTQCLTVRGLKREEGPQSPLPPFQRPPPPCSWQSASPELPRRGLSPARAEPDHSTCQNSCLGAWACTTHAPASASRGLTACLVLRPPLPQLADILLRRGRL